MKKLVSIKREKGELLGLAEFLDNGVRKFARFDKSWTNDQVCKNFGIESAKSESSPQSRKKSE